MRVLAATNKDLEREVASGKFREDLYFRLNVVPIRSPALRERVEDIPLLAQAFFKQFCRENGGRERPADPEVFDLLTQRPWPGNVRELKNVVERMVILGGPRITVADVPQGSGSRTRRAMRTRAQRDAATATRTAPAASACRSPPTSASRCASSATAPKPNTCARSLRQCEWNISRAAGQLGIERTNLHKKMRAFGIRRDPAIGRTSREPTRRAALRSRARGRHARLLSSPSGTRC